MNSNDISPEAIRERRSSLPGSNNPKHTLEVKELSDDVIMRVINPFNKMVVQKTGKTIFQLIEENLL